MSNLPLSVLLVSGSSEQRERYAASLHEGGFSTVEAGTTSEAIRLALECPPTLIVTDVRPEGGDSGLDLIRRLKQDTRMRYVPVVALTSNVLTHDREIAAHAGCDLFLTTSCSPRTLSTIVAALLERRSRLYREAEVRP